MEQLKWIPPLHNITQSLVDIEAEHIPKLCLKESKIEFSPINSILCLMPICLQDKVNPTPMNNLKLNFCMSQIDTQSNMKETHNLIQLNQTSLNNFSVLFNEKPFANIKSGIFDDERKDPILLVTDNDFDRNKQHFELLQASRLMDFETSNSKTFKENWLLNSRHFISSMKSFN